MSAQDPDFHDKIADIINEATGEEGILVECYALVAAYSTVSGPRSSLFTWWSDSPNWKLLGMVEGMSEVVRVAIRKTYQEED